MIIEEMFKGLTTAIMSEPSNQNKKNHDMCIDVYSKTQLIDLSRVLEPYSSLSEIEFKGDMVDGEAVYEFTVPKNIKSVQLPFDTNFFALSGDKCSFLREYDVNVYTGCLCYILEDKLQGFKRAVANKRDVAPYMIYQSFNIRYDWVEDALVICMTIPNFVVKKFSVLNDVKSWIEKYVSNMAYDICSLLSNLETLSPKKNDIYVVDAERPTYYTKKLTKETIKVNRPVYIYVDKKDGEEKIKSVKSEIGRRQIRQSLTWLVRGHWRKLSDMHKRGKNANGEYIVEGFTWVVPYKKGDKDGIPQQKTYIALRKEM